MIGKIPMPPVDIVQVIEQHSSLPALESSEFRQQQGSTGRIFVPHGRRHQDAVALFNGDDEVIQGNVRAAV